MARHARWVLALLALLALPLPGEARSLLIERFDADIAVRPDGSVEVAETIRARFTGRWNGLFRTIPIEYRTPQGMNYTLLLDLGAVTDDAGQPLRHEVSRERHYRKVKVWVPGAENATRTVVLRYRARNGLKFFDQHDELYWNVTGDEWPFPIQAASARIQLPPGATGLRAIAFTGPHGSREQAAEIQVSGQEVTVATTRRLNFREGLTVAVGWDPGLVHRPGLVEQALLFLRSNWMLGMPVLVFALMFSLWHTRGRDPRRRPIAAQYEPPEGLTPGELGTLLDNSPDMRDITATLVDLAVRGYLRIEEREEPALLGLTSRTDYRFHRLKPESAWDDLAPHERALLGALFSAGRRGSVDASELERRFYTHLKSIRNRIFDRLLERGYYARRPDTIRRVFVLIGGAVLFLGAMAGVGLSEAQGQSPLTGLLAAFLSGLAVVGFGWVMPARTVRGARVLEGILGFEEFLSRVEGERLRSVVKTPELFEKFLPHAMALGVETEWAKAFESLYRQSPDWYRGGHPEGFHSRALVSRLGAMSSRTGSAMTSAPRSSGGSGFGGGGGSSGGGRGGGGGGGF